MTIRILDTLLDTARAHPACCCSHCSGPRPVAKGQCEQSSPRSGFSLVVVVCMCLKSWGNLWPLSRNTCVYKSSIVWSPVTAHASVHSVITLFMNGFDWRATQGEAAFINGKGWYNRLDLNINSTSENRTGKMAKPRWLSECVTSADK